MYVQGVIRQRVAPPITAPLVLSGFKHKCAMLSQYTITVTFASQVSSDLSSGRRPTSKSDEFCDANVIVVEPQRCENTGLYCEMMQSLAARPATKQEKSDEGMKKRTKKRGMKKKICRKSTKLREHLNVDVNVSLLVS